MCGRFLHPHVAWLAFDLPTPKPRATRHITKLSCTYVMFENSNQKLASISLTTRLLLVRNCCNKNVARRSSRLFFYRNYIFVAYYSIMGLFEIQGNEKKNNARRRLLMVEACFPCFYFQNKKNVMRRRSLPCFSMSSKHETGAQTETSSDLPANLPRTVLHYSSARPAAAAPLTLRHNFPSSPMSSSPARSSTSCCLLRWSH